MNASQEQFRTEYDAFGNIKLVPTVESSTGLIANPVSDSISPAVFTDGQMNAEIGMISGYLQSSNFVAGSKGWQVKSDGNAEFQDIKARGDVTADTLTIGGGIEITLSPGTNLIQAAINQCNAAGGGTVRLSPGTYIENIALVLYSNVDLLGTGFTNTIINFNSTAANLTLTGTDIYTTGTIDSISSGVNVVGSGTVWTAAMVGRQIFIDNRWYVIAARTDNTHITLASAYADGATYAGTYRIVNPIRDCTINGITFQGSTGTAIVGTDVRDINLLNLKFVSNNKGFALTNFMNILPEVCSVVANTSNGYELTNGSFADFYAVASIANGGHGAVLNTIKACPWINCAADSNTADGFNCTSVTNSLFKLEASSNGGQGIEFVSGCNNNTIDNFLVNNNTSDGIKLTATSDNNIIGPGICGGNGGYGINIAASTCDNNQITSVSYPVANTSGNTNDSGTGTTDIVANPARISKTFTAAENISANNAVVLSPIGGMQFENDSGSTLTTSIVSYWKFNETAGATTADDYYGANDLTKGGEATFATGKVSNGTDLELTTSDYWVITDAGQTGLDITGDISFSCWVKIEQLPSTATTTFCVASKWVTGDRSWFLEILNTDKLRFGFYDASANATVVDSDAAFVVEGNVGNWVHLAVTADVSVPTVVMYKNGSPVASTASSTNATSIKNSATEFNIGARSVHTEEFFDGMIDEFGIWSKVLSATEVTDLYNSGNGQTMQNYTAGQLLQGSAKYSTRYKPFIGFVPSAITSGNSGTVYLGGTISGFTGLYTGSQYYLSDVLGGVARVVGTNTRKVGIATSTTELLITNIW